MSLSGPQIPMMACRFRLSCSSGHREAPAGYSGTRISSSLHPKRKAGTLDRTSGLDDNPHANLVTSPAASPFRPPAGLSTFRAKCSLTVSTPGSMGPCQFFRVRSHTCQVREGCEKPCLAGSVHGEQRTRRRGGHGSGHRQLALPFANTFRFRLFGKVESGHQSLAAATPVNSLLQLSG